MISFITVTSLGEIQQYSVTTEEEYARLAASMTDGRSLHKSEHIDIYANYWDQGQVRNKGQAPSAYHVFSYEGKAWVDPRTVNDVKRATNAVINKAWESANLSGFIHQGLVFATDVSSRSDIDGINGYVALTGTFPDGWAGVWKAKDNSYLPITTVEQWVAFYTSMVRAGNENFAKAQQLKAQIAAATTKEEVEAIAW